MIDRFMASAAAAAAAVLSKSMRYEVIEVEHDKLAVAKACRYMCMYVCMYDTNITK